MNLSILNLLSSLSFSSFKNHTKSPQMRITTTATTPTTTQNTCSSDIIPTRSTAKRPKTMSINHHQSLLPGLPDHISQLCLSLVPPSTLSSVCHSWRRLIYSPSFPPFLSIYCILLPTQIVINCPSSLITDQRQLHLSNAIQFASYDPISSTWLPLPSLPPDPPLRFLLRHPSFISRNLPVQSVTVSGNLILLAATADQLLPALPRPLIFNPLNGTWTYGPSLLTPRRWCATGSSGGVVYVASGIGSHYSPEVARSVEKWDLNNYNQGGGFDDNNRIGTSKEAITSARSAHSMSSGCGYPVNKMIGTSKVITNCKTSENNKWIWEKVGELRDAKFSREAIDAIGWREKLCMVNVKGDAAKEGIIYDVKNDVWVDMPEGMLQGWRGPAAAMDEEIIFCVDESKGVLKKYFPEMDGWDLVLENEMLKGAQNMAMGGGKACVVCRGGREIFVADVAAGTPRFWVVEAPQGFEALDVHILPRMSR